MYLIYLDSLLCSEKCSLRFRDCLLDLTLLVILFNKVYYIFYMYVCKCNGVCAVIKIYIYVDT